jgi:hypothetical protein
MHSKISSIYNLMIMPESYENQETERSQYCINLIESEEWSYSLSHALL